LPNGIVSVQNTAQTMCCECAVIRIGDTPGTLSVISALKDRLGDIIEPDFGLLDELLRLEVLSRRQCARVRSERTVYERNDALLELLTSEVQCDKFLKALQRTHQQHVGNFIVQNRGQKHKYDVVTYQLNVIVVAEYGDHNHSDKVSNVAVALRVSCRRIVLRKTQRPSKIIRTALHVAGHECSFNYFPKCSASWVSILHQPVMVVRNSDRWFLFCV